MLRRSLEIGESKLGLDHPDNLGRLNNLSLLLCETGRLKEAEPLLRRAVAVAEKGFGTDHPMVAVLLNSLGQLLQESDRRDEAEPLMRRALEILLKFSRAAGHPHPHLQSALQNYKNSLIELGRNDDENYRPTMGNGPGVLFANSHKTS